MSRIKYRLQQFTDRMRNIRYWLPVIWGDRDWDWWYLVVILRHKLAALNNEMAHDKVSKNIHLCVLLCDRIMDESRYIDKAQARQDFFRRRADIVDQCYHVDYLKKQDIALLTEIIRKHLYSWWD